MMEEQDAVMDVDSGPVLPESGPVRAVSDPVRAVSDPDGLLKRSRELLDLFWDIAKPDRDTRLQAAEKLVDYVKKSGESDELKFVVRRLVNGLSHNREHARTGYSATLAQVLSVFEEVSLKDTLDQIKDKHNLQTSSKKMIRNVVFGSFFGVLALSQSTRLHKEPQVLLECIKVLQTLSQFGDHLRELPRKTIVDILNQTSEEVFEEVLLAALQTDLSSALSSPEQLELLLVAMQRFPSIIKPAKLKKLLGTTNIINKQTIPRLVEVLKSAARSVKKECVLPAVALDLLQVSVREESFEMFWQQLVINGLLTDPAGPSHYLAFRLLGAALPLLSDSQLKFVLSGEVMRRYGEHTVSAQLPGRFRFGPEMDSSVNRFLQSCRDADRQLTVVLAFSRLTHQGQPVTPSFWKVLEQLEPSALTRYVDWLKEMFCQPQLDQNLESKQRDNQESTDQTEACVSRFRKWIIPRLTFIGENFQMKKEEELIMGIARFLFFHAFFETKKATKTIPETQSCLSIKLDQNIRNTCSSSFYSLLHYLCVLPAPEEGDRKDPQTKRGVLGVMADGTTWLYQLVQFADSLLTHTTHTQPVQNLTPEHTHAWTSMLESVETLMKKMKKTPAPEHTAFQQLFIIIGLQIFKMPDDSVELLKDLRSCMEKAQAKKPKKKKKQTGVDEGEEPHWVEVVVEILLSLLSQPSRVIRNICRISFSHICPHLTQPALRAILNVLDPTKDEEESGVMVTDVKEEKKKKQRDEEEEEEEEREDEEESDSDSDDDEEEDEDDVMEEEQEEVDQSFRLELMKVLQGQNALATEEDDDDDEEELDDEAMMKLDTRLSTLFSEQKKKIQAKKDEKERIQREKVLVKDFKIKVLDLLEVFLVKQGSSSLVLEMIEPLLVLIDNSLGSERGQQEVDFLRRTANIFMNQLCRGKHYCRNVEGREAELHEMLERVIGRAQKVQDSSVALYYFSAALYLVKVLQGGVKTDDTHTPADQERILGKADVNRVTQCFREALTSFLTRRKSPLTGEMFTNLFNRFPVVCVNLLDTVVENITAGVREHQQAQVCVMLIRALQCKEVRMMMTEAQWTELCNTTTQQLTKSLQQVEIKNKAVRDKTVKILELSSVLIKTVHSQKLEVQLDPLRDALRNLNTEGELQRPGQLEDTYWSIMRLFSIQKPKVEKVKKVVEEQTEQQEEKKKKKKGFLPESKKRKNRKKAQVLESQDPAGGGGGRGGAGGGGGGGGGGEGGKKKKKNKRKNKKRSEGGGEEDQPPAKKAKTPPPAQSQKQKKKKKSKGGGASVE